MVCPLTTAVMSAALGLLGSPDAACDVGCCPDELLDGPDELLDGADDEHPPAKTITGAETTHTANRHRAVKPNIAHSRH